jgi:hypothetical protein
MSFLTINERLAIDKINNNVVFYLYHNKLLHKNYIKKKELNDLLKFINNTINNIIINIDSGKLEVFNKTINMYILSLFTNIIFKSNKDRLKFIVEKLETYFN